MDFGIGLLLVGLLIGLVMLGAPIGVTLILLAAMGWGVLVVWRRLTRRT